jgi:hypothetical protein
MGAAIIVHYHFILRRLQIPIFHPICHLASQSFAERRSNGSANLKKKDATDQMKETHFGCVFVLQFRIIARQDIQANYNIHSFISAIFQDALAVRFIYKKMFTKCLCVTKRKLISDPGIGVLPH